MTRAVLPAFVAGRAISVALWHTGQLEFLTAMWLTVYGAGALATNFFAPCSIAWLGASCLVLSVVVLVTLPGWPLLTMAVGFGSDACGLRRARVGGRATPGMRTTGVVGDIGGTDMTGKFSKVDLARLAADVAAFDKPEHDVHVKGRLAIISVLAATE